jgi:hypothetical protein
MCTFSQKKILKKDYEYMVSNKGKERAFLPQFPLSPVVI